METDICNGCRLGFTCTLDCLCSKCLVVMVCKTACYPRYLQICKESGFEPHSQPYFEEHLQPLI